MQTRTAYTTEQEKETIKDSAEDLIKHASDYAETFYRRTMLHASEKVVKTGAGLINGLVAAVLALVVFFFLNFALGWWLGQLMDNRALGFLVLGGFYLLLLVIMIATKKSMLNLFRNMLTKMIYD